MSRSPPNGEGERPLARDGRRPETAPIPVRPDQSCSVLETHHDGGRLDNGDRLLTLSQLELLDGRVGDG